MYESACFSTPGKLSIRGYMPVTYPRSIIEKGTRAGLGSRVRCLIPDAIISLQGVDPNRPAFSSWCLLLQFGPEGGTISCRPLGRQGLRLQLFVAGSRGRNRKRSPSGSRASHVEYFPESGWTGGGNWGADLSARGWSAGRSTHV